MRDIRKLPASAGAQWLLDTFSLYRRAPLQLAVLGIIGMLVSSLMFALSQALPSWIGTAVQMVWLATGPVVFGGMLWAVSEIDQGHRALPTHLLQPIRDRRVFHLLLPLLIYFTAMLLLGSLLLAMIGKEGLASIAQATLDLQALQQADTPASSEQMQAVFDPVPVKRILLWMALTFGVFVALSMAMFTQPALVMFDRQSGMHALRMSLQGCIENFTAMAVFMLLGLIASVCINVLFFIVANIATLFAGPGVGMAVLNLGMITVMMPLYVGAVYAAWKQMFAHRTRSTPPPVPPANGPKNIFAA